MVGSPAMNLHGWRQLAEWSIEYSLLKPEEKIKALAIFHLDWERFCEWIISKYGDHADTLDVSLG
jgi:adenosine deaminase CECR1